MIPAYLLAAILERPEDDCVRLALADLLLDADDPAERARGEFIRVQCALAGVVCNWVAEGGDSCADWNRRRPPYRTLTWCQACVRAEALCRREGELLGENVSTDKTTVCPRYYRWCEEAGIDPCWVVVPGFGVGANETSKNSFCRGFVERIALPLAAFLTHAAALARCCPLSAVRLVDLDPVGPIMGGPHAGKWFWVRRDLNDELYGPLVGAGRLTEHMVTSQVFDSAAAAHAALSAACVTLARRQAFPCGRCGSLGYVQTMDGSGDGCPHCGGSGVRVTAAALSGPSPPP